MMTTSTYATPVSAPSAVRLEGDLDASNAAPLRRQLRALFDAGATGVEVDVSHLDFIDAAGLGVLVSAHRLFAVRGGRVRLRDPQGPVRRVLEVTGLDATFGVARR